MRKQSSHPLLLGLTSATWSRWLQDSFIVLPSVLAKFMFSSLAARPPG